jgi:hypothetical protein
MSLPPSPDSQRFVFELELEISRAFGLLAGELATLLADGLIEMDHQGILFPGVTTPEAGDRLLGVGIGAIGYGTRSRTGPVDVTPQQGEAAGGPVGKLNRDQEERLDGAQFDLQAVQGQLRMLMAKLRGMLDRSHHRTPLTAADQATAESLLAASAAVCAAVEEAVKPVL